MTSSCSHSPDSRRPPASGTTWPACTTRRRRLASLFVNGVLADTVHNVVAGPATGPTGIGRGKFAGNRVDFVNGAIDDVRLFQTPLKAADLLQVARVGDSHADRPIAGGAGNAPDRCRPPRPRGEPDLPTA